MATNVFSAEEMKKKGGDDTKVSLPPLVLPWNQLRFRAIEKQSTEFTCGSASLATLAKYFLGRNVSEEQVTNQIKKHHTEESWNKLQKDGLSLFELKRAANELGLEAAAYKGKLADLAELHGPVILHLDQGGFKHYVVLKSFSNDKIELADPVRGLIRMTAEDFSSAWTGYFMALWIKGEPMPETYPLNSIPDSSLAERDLLRRIIYAEPLGSTAYR
ncbi:MAG: cysteine peptidase family C39 domain-containing protein [Gallionella sp.]|nr:cysteine peptidase family C39 domain-containing protein [Gallionella sp.]